MPHKIGPGIVSNDNGTGHACCHCNKLSNSYLIKIRDLFEELTTCEKLINDVIKTSIKISHESYEYLRKLLIKELYESRMKLEVIKNDTDVDANVTLIRRQINIIKNLINELS